MTILKISPAGQDLSQEGTDGVAAGEKQLTIRLDEDALDWLKGHGKGHQTRINRILRVVMESQPPPRAQR